MLALAKVALVFWVCRYTAETGLSTQRQNFYFERVQKCQPCKIFGLARVLDVVWASPCTAGAPSVSRRDCFTNTQASVVHLSRLFHSLSVVSSYRICEFKPCLTLRWPLLSSSQSRKRKQTGISGGSCLPPSFLVKWEICIFTGQHRILHTNNV